MAVTATHLTTGSDTTNQTGPYSTASITPTANRLVLAAVAVTVGASPTPALTLSGCGLTWVQVDQTVAGARTVHLFRAMGAAPTAGVLSITGDGTTTMTSALWTVAEFAGVDTSGTNGSGAIVQSVNAKPANTTSVSVAFGSAITAGNATFGAVAPAVAEAPAAGSGWTSLGSTTQTAPTTGLLGEWAAAGQQNVTASWTTSASPFVAGAEIKAGGPSAVSSALSGTGTLTAGTTPAATRAAALGGSGTLTTTQTTTQASAASLSGSGSLSATPTPSVARTAALGGSGTLAASSSPSVARAAALSGTGTLSAATSGFVAAPFSGSGTLTAAQSPAVARAAALSGSGTLSATQLPAATRSAALSGSGALTAAAVFAATRSAALSGSGSLLARIAYRFSVWTGTTWARVAPRVWTGTSWDDVTVTVVDD